MNNDAFNAIKQAGIFAKPTWFSMDGTIVSPESPDKFLFFLGLKKVCNRFFPQDHNPLSIQFQVNSDLFKSMPDDGTAKKRLIEKNAYNALKSNGIINSMEKNTCFRISFPLLEYDSTTQTVTVALGELFMPFFNSFNNEPYSLSVEKKSSYNAPKKPYLTECRLTLYAPANSSLNQSEQPLIINTFEFKNDFVRNCFYANNLVIIELIDDHIYLSEYYPKQRYHQSEFPHPTNHRIAFYSAKTKKLLLSIQLPLPDQYKIDKVCYSLEYADKEAICLYDWINKRYISFNYIFETFEDLINKNQPQKKVQDDITIITPIMQETALEPKPIESLSTIAIDPSNNQIEESHPEKDPQNSIIDKNRQQEAIVTIPLQEEAIKTNSETPIRQNGIPDSHWKNLTNFIQCHYKTISFSLIFCKSIIMINKALLKKSASILKGI